MINSTDDLANKLWKAANFYDEFGLSPKTAKLLYDASNIARSVNGLVDKNDKLKTENDKLKDENTRLRNEVDNLLDFEHLTSVAVAYSGCDECGEYKKTMLRLFDENTKLLKLVGMIGNVCDGTSEACKYCKNYSATNDECMMLKQMRELRNELAK